MKIENAQYSSDVPDCDLRGVYRLGLLSTICDKNVPYNSATGAASTGPCRFARITDLVIAPRKRRSYSPGPYHGVTVRRLRITHDLGMSE